MLTVDDPESNVTGGRYHSERRGQLVHTYLNYLEVLDRTTPQLTIALVSVTRSVLARGLTRRAKRKNQKVNLKRKLKTIAKKMKLKQKLRKRLKGI